MQSIKNLEPSRAKFMTVGEESVVKYTYVISSIKLPHAFIILFLNVKKFIPKLMLA